MIHFWNRRGLCVPQQRGWEAEGGAEKQSEKHVFQVDVVSVGEGGGMAVLRCGKRRPEFRHRMER